VRARVSDRILFSAILRASNVPEAQLDSVFVLVDRMEREPKEQLVEKLQNDDAIDLSKEQIDSILGVLDVSGVDEIERAFPRDEPVLDRTAELRRYLSVLEDLGFAEFVEVDLKIVRGLAYYTGIVFEIFDRVGELRAICGGGRYDGLLERVGGDSLPAAGFGMGDVVLGELLKDRDLVPDYRPEVDYFIVSIDETQRPLARRIASAQRLSGLSVVYPVGPQSVRRQFSSAAAAGAGSVIVLGPEEVDRGVATVRDMASGGEKEVPLERLTRREAEGKAASVSGEGEEE
jgi:histidyl-tRNA synthetase